MPSYQTNGMGPGTGAAIVTQGLGDGSLAYDATRYGNSLAALMDDAKDILGFEDDDIYGDERWTRWLNQSRDDLLSEMGGLLPVSQVWFTATGLTEYDLLPYGFLRIDRLGYRDGPGEGAGVDVAWLPLYSRADANVYRAEPEARTGFPGLAYVTGIGSIGFTDAPATGTVYVQGPRLPSPLLEGNDRTDLPRLFNEVLALGAAMRACRHDMGRSESGIQLPLFGQERQAKITNLKLLMKKMAPGRAGFVTAPGYAESTYR